ncbi:hypothetical protein [Micavibrio aeruginosavorus]|uniref:hypothetical protein n=1 Tax=Micavibrio aeruginosavorus TaxID=349221 RepID=UPI003F4A9340
MSTNNASAPDLFDALPNASILHKLEAKCPGAALCVLDRAEKIQKARHAEELESLTAPKLPLKKRITDVFKSIARSFSEAMISYPGPHYGPEYAGRATHDRMDAYESVRTRNVIEAIRGDIAHVADDLRAAIRAEMVTRKVTVKDLGLTRAEIVDLHLVVAKPAPKSGPAPR